jgi:hypothetical protein
MNKNVLTIGMVVGAIVSILPSAHAGSIASGMYSDHYLSGYVLTVKNNTTIVIMPAPEKLEEIYRQRKEADLKNAREMARKLRENYPGWKESLPICPCHEEEIKKRSEFDWSTYLVRRHHKGAHRAYRQVNGIKPFPSNSNLPPIEPGQQCTYDKARRLITSGSGAGTPDAYSPGRNKSGISRLHIKWDVNPANTLSLSEYHQTWTPNQGSGCNGSIERGTSVPIDGKPSTNQKPSRKQKPKPIDMEINGPRGPLRDLLEQIRKGK